MPYLADRVQETTATTGTGAVTLAGAVAGYQTFASGFASQSVTVGYLLVSGSNWEVGKGVFNGTTGLTRDTVRSSSNGGSLITLSGTSNVFCTASAELLDNANTGMQVAMGRGWAMP
ncbi:hypothetical protein UFOVP228_73 [uncultured Caudovirales phage]|uniref:Uncharacterized protein n=1 Tax=uncultured Caudovirales phage TaxID=2100421 RepID=A0A6J7WRL8_9CAUD|nr:hypothetical protein UFOVP47_29 [uncultured Caudovirales phage]CAB5219448.1 hypothetical protein UFOVP228_73 [uncultured Caudovirales phage]